MMRKAVLAFVAISLASSVAWAQSDPPVASTKIEIDSETFVLIGTDGQPVSGQGLIVDGDIPSPHDLNLDNVVRVWQIVQQITGVNKDKPPHITFLLFSEDVPEWKAVWVKEHPQFAAEALNRIDSAYHFEDTNRIQVNPGVFRNFRGLGVGYYILGHEMMHYLFDGVIPVKDHHCFFKNSGLNKRLRKELVDEGISHPFLAQERESIGANVSDGCDE